MKLALFRTPHSEKPSPGDELTEKYCEEWVRVSEWVDVEFPPLSDEGRQLQLASIEKAREAARRYFETQMERINKQEQALS